MPEPMDLLEDESAIDDGLAFLDDERIEYVPTPVGPDDPLQFPVKFVTGAAGTGKTYWAKRQVEANPKWGVLAATTGIAAVNLGTNTLNSILKYFDTARLQDAFVTGRLQRVLGGLADRAQWLVVDEVSMMDGEQLDVLVSAMQNVAEARLSKGLGPMGLAVTGDFCQLPPVKAKWAFEAGTWHHFERSTERLTKIWRQESLDLVTALNHLRQGAGDDGASALESAGCKFSTAVDLGFQGTTIMGKNKSVDKFNLLRLRGVKGRAMAFRSRQWGQGLKEWFRLIPQTLDLRVGSLVMILANSPMEGYANGDLGTVEELEGSDSPFVCAVRLKRDGEVRRVRMITRTNALASPPQGMKHKDFKEWSVDDQEAGVEAPWGEPYFDEKQGRYVVGAVRFMPLRLGYATTVHKSQGLTLDRIQVDVRDGFMGEPAMCYVALSRGRSVEGLKVVGTPGILAKRCNIDEKVRPWL